MREQQALLLGPALQVAEVDPVEFRTLLGDDGEGLPQRLLGEDPGAEHLDLDHAAQWRVLTKESIGLQPTEQLGGTSDNLLPAARAMAEALEHVVERAHVLVDLAAHLARRVGEERRRIGRGEPLGQRQPGGCSGAVVVEVDAEQAFAVVRSEHDEDRTDRQARRTGTPIGRKEATLCSRRAGPAWCWVRTG